MPEDSAPGDCLPLGQVAHAGRARDNPPALDSRTAGRGGKHGATAWLRCRVRRLSRLLGGRLRLMGSGRNLRVVVDPVLPATSVAALPPESRKAGSPELRVLQAGDVANARSDLATVLDRHPAARALWPSLALIERGLSKHGGAGLVRMSAAVLRDAAKVLGRLVDDWCEPGLVALYEHVILVLRTVHGEDPPYDPARAERRFEAQVPVQVQDGSMTDFMTIDRLWDQRLAREA